MNAPHFGREHKPHRKQFTSRGVDSHSFDNFRGAPAALAAHEHPSSVMQQSATLRGQNIPDANLACE